MNKKPTMILALLAVLLSTVSLTAAAEISYAVKGIINDVYDLAKTKMATEYRVELNKSDYSVEFTSKKTNNTDFWVSAKEENGRVRLEMHMRGYNISAKDRNEFHKKLSAAKSAQNEIEKDSRVKVEFDANSTEKDFAESVSFAVNAGAITAEEFLDNFRVYRTELNSAKEKFQVAYKMRLQGKNNEGNENRNNKGPGYDKKDNGGSKKGGKLLLPVAEGEVNVVAKPFEIEDVKVRVLNDENAVLRDFGKDMPAIECQYLEFEVKYTPNTNDKYAEMGFRLYTPDGQLIVSDLNNDFSFREIIETKGKKKSETLNKKFGTSKHGFWHPGSYLLEIYGNGVKISEKPIELTKIR